MNGSLFKITKEESELLMDIIRTENPCQKSKELTPYSKMISFQRYLWMKKLMIE